MCDNLMIVFALPVLCFVHLVCGLENLALNKLTWQEHPWPDSTGDFGSDNAVDGVYTDRGTGGQCTINADGHYTAEWGVDLGSVFSISRINIYYRTDNVADPTFYANRMAGFSLYVSNTTSTKQRFLCYKDQSIGTPSVDQTIPCSFYGRYVIYYNERSRYSPSYFSQYAYNELCELQVFGCRGNYGDGCLYACPTNCLNGNCEEHTGHCLRCSAGYYGQLCLYECPPGSYGYNCINRCSEHCLVSFSCDHVTGKCNDGCKLGWAGDTCKECHNGYYGINCINRCSENCYMPQSCDKSSGKCYRGCQPGWRGNTCDHECLPGSYGYNCINRCSEHCSDSLRCDHVTGKCNDGCKLGWAGDTCHECQSGYYGINCNNHCSANCYVPQSCDKSSGQCYRGCQPGWRGNTCSNECSQGYYGYKCSNPCSEHCSVANSCDHVTGKCND